MKDTEHLFFICFFSKRLWDNILLWLEVHIVGAVAGAGAEHLYQFSQALKGKVKKKKNVFYG